MYPGSEIKYVSYVSFGECADNRGSYETSDRRDSIRYAHDYAYKTHSKNALNYYYATLAWHVSVN